MELLTWRHLSASCPPHGASCPPTVALMNELMSRLSDRSVKQPPPETVVRSPCNRAPRQPARRGLGRWSKPQIPEVGRKRWTGAELKRRANEGGGGSVVWVLVLLPRR